MRKTFIILCIWSIIVGCSQEQKEDDTSSKEKEGWKLVWHDEFNRAISLLLVYGLKYGVVLLPLPIGAKQ